MKAKVNESSCERIFLISDRADGEVAEYDPRHEQSWQQQARDCATRDDTEGGGDDEAAAVKEVSKEEGDTLTATPTSTEGL